MGKAAASQLEIRQVGVDDLRNHGQHLIAQHWHEVGHDHSLQVNPMWPRYYAIELAGGLMAFGAYLEGVLVGYCVTFLGQHHHCTELIHATVDAIFVQREYRRTGIAQRLIRETEAEARSLHAKVIAWHAPQGGALEAVLCRAGYAVRETIYERSL